MHLTLHCTKIPIQNARADEGRDGTAEPVSRDRILRRERGKVKFTSPAQLTIGLANHIRSTANLLNVMTILYPTQIHTHTAVGLAQSAACFSFNLAENKQPAALLYFSSITLH